MRTWPVLTEYDRDYLARIALPLGGIGTGTVSLGGRGDLRDWEIMNRPAKGFVPSFGRGVCPFFALYVESPGGKTVTTALEGPLETFEYDGDSGSRAPNHGLPRFRECRFSAAYPLGQVHLSDPRVPVTARLEAFNPLVPGDADASGLPVALLRYVISNPGPSDVRISICGSLPNFIGSDGAESHPGSDRGPRANRNQWRQTEQLRGVFMDSEGVEPTDPAWGTIALTTTAREMVSGREHWTPERHWGEALLDFWEDFSENGDLSPREGHEEDLPVASVAVGTEIPAGQSRRITFLLSWHFPNRMTWTPCGEEEECEGPDRIGNYYTEQFEDAWEAAEHFAENRDEMETKTVPFVKAFAQSDLPQAVKEAALFNLSTLRTQTCFRTPDGHFYGWEGCCDRAGCCYGSCTHVWNYEQATAFLFGDLALGMREVEFEHATDTQGRMSFRVNLPLERAQRQGVAAADGDAR